MAESSYSQSYNRIISLAPSLTKSLYLLNAEDQLTACTSYCDTPDSDKKEIVASAIKVNLEKIVSLRPDLIIVMPLTNPETIASLKKFGIRVEEFSSPLTFDEICEQFLQLGKMAGKEHLAVDIVRKSKAKVDSLISLQNLIRSQTVFFQIGANPIFTVLPNTFMNDYISFIGCENIAFDMKGGTISRESVLARNPDIIFVATMGVIGAEEKKIWKSYNELNAAKNDHIFIIDSDLSCVPTPVTFAQTLEIMFQQLSMN